MSLGPGTRLGPYEVLAAIGAGGMGEVYRARDTKLNRDVALKILPPAFASDPDRLARFHREAQVLASLNHPHVGAIYGFEDSGDTHALVLELVDGPTLADRIAQGPIPIDEALPISIQIAEALEAAHEQGIIHRDLKPANIKLRPDATVKVLDFGLAKLAEPGFGIRDSGFAGATGAMSMSPTITSPAMITGVGMLLGTAAYMAPEQARGMAVDKRADIWAFGCVLFEMLTGARAFTAENIPDTLVQLLERDPLWSLLPPSTPESVRRLLVRCLRKDPRIRLQHMGDVRIEIDDAATERLQVRAEQRPRWRFASMSVIAAAGMVGGALAMRQFSFDAGTVAVPVHLNVELPAGVSLPLDTEHPVLALSPDGSRLVFLGDEAGHRRLYLRELSDSRSRVIAGSDGAVDPFFSPDGSSITFFNGAAIQTIALSGGAPRSIHAATAAPVNRGATWLADNTLIYAASPNSGLSRGTVGDDRPPAMNDWSYVAGLAVIRGPNATPDFLLATPGVGNWEFPTSWSPDGKWLAFTRYRSGGGIDVELMPVSGSPTPLPYASDAASEVGAVFSHGGSDIAYVSDISGREEVYVRPFPGPGDATLVSTNGGIEPLWSRDGSELFYREGDAIKAVRFGPHGTHRPPITLFEGRYEHVPYGGLEANYDVSLDGTRFLIVRRKRSTQPTAIHVVVNWPQALLASTPDRR